MEPDDEIGPQLRARGFDPGDVRWVVLTHLHTDHAGGLAHFPNSEIVITREEFEYAKGRRGRAARLPEPALAGLARSHARRGSRRR